MAWAIITIYASKCVEMDPQQILKTSNFYSRCKNVWHRKNLREGVGTTPPLVAGRLNINERMCRAAVSLIACARCAMFSCYSRVTVVYICLLMTWRRNWSRSSALVNFLLNSPIKATPCSANPFTSRCPAFVFWPLGRMFWNHNFQELTQ